MFELDKVIDTEVLKSIPQQPQVQCSVLDQLKASEALMRKFGLYDASSFMRDQINDMEHGLIVRNRKFGK